MKLTIVTGTVERPPAIRRLVSSIFEHSRVPDWELIVADASKEPLILKHSRVQVLHEWPRAGHAVGYNRAFRAARGEFVCWLNDDVVVTPGWDSAAVRFMEENPWCGLGAIYYSESGCCPHINFYPYQDMPYANFGIIRKTLGDKIGWFDEECRMYGSDNSITFKTVLAGYGVAGVRGSKVEHWPVLDEIKRQNVAGQAEDARHLMDIYRGKIDLIRNKMRRYPSSPMVTQ